MLRPPRIPFLYASCCLGILISACAKPVPADLPVPHAAAPLQVPPTVTRLAVVLPTTYDRDFRAAYRRLEGGAFDLKNQRPLLKILERADLATVMTEQRFQLEGAVAEETAIRIGRMAGADTVLIFQVEGPSLRDRLLARVQGGLPPVFVVSKVINVESAEVLYFDLVTVRFPEIERDTLFFSERPLIRTALDQGVAESLSHLHAAFR